MNQGLPAKLAEITSQGNITAIDTTQDALSALISGAAIGIYGGLMMADGSIRHFATHSIMQLSSPERSKLINDLTSRIL